MRSPSVLEDLPGKLDIERHSPSSLYFSEPSRGAQFICSLAMPCTDTFIHNKQFGYDCNKSEYNQGIALSHTAYQRMLPRGRAT